jgi:hypothetical protein
MLEYNAPADLFDTDPMWNRRLSKLPEKTFCIILRDFGFRLYY